MNDGTGDLTLELTNTIKRRAGGWEVVSGPPPFLSAVSAVDGAPYLGMSKRSSCAPRRRLGRWWTQLASHGADLIKVYENVSREAYFAIIDEARQGRSP